MPQTVPYGSWKSTITSDLIVSETIGLGQIALDGDDIYWIESRPSEAGRNVLMRMDSQGETLDVTPPQFNVRTRVHEYGGGAFAVSVGGVYFCNFADPIAISLMEGPHIGSSKAISAPHVTIPRLEADNHDTR